MVQRIKICFTFALLYLEDNFIKDSFHLVFWGWSLPQWEALFFYS